VVGTVVDAVGEGVSDAEISFTPTSPFFHGDKRIIKGATAQTDANGNFSLSVVESESVEKTYRVQIKYNDLNGKQVSDTFDDVTVKDQVVMKLSTVAT
jgi:hypothetical protein